ncbi:MAG: methyltransferase domain-containing protein [Eubacteriales bacterium]
MIHNLPAAFCARMKKILGEEAYAAFLSSYDDDAIAQRGLRVNPFKYSRDAFLAAVDLPLRPTSFDENGFFLDCSETGTGKHPLHHAGAFYLQEPAAMLPVAAASDYLHPGDYVLDVCAAPGGKSTQLASKIGRSGLLVSNEFVSSRAKVLLSNIERLGIPNAVVTNTDAAHLRKWYEGCFDCVLVDAPCSGEGMFRKNPQAVTEWSEENVAMCAKRSFEILSDAQFCLRPGGILIYATCTFAAEENEELIARFLEVFPNYTAEILPDTVRAVTAPGLSVAGCKEDLTRAARCYPHITGGEGQFVCVLKKGGEAPRVPIITDWETITKQETVAAEMLLRELFPQNNVIPKIRKKNGQLHAVLVHLGVSGSCLSCGVTLGEFRGNRIVPHHQLFSAYGSQMRRCWNFHADDPRILRYLHGETVSVEESDCTGENSDGFGCVTVEGCALGGAKRVGDTLKNHYPKGLRIQGI